MCFSLAWGIFTSFILFASGTMADHYFTYHNFRSYVVQPRFISHPPMDLRKSNFFNFTIELRGGNDLIEILDARFTNFINESKDTEIRNGMKYRIRVKYPNGMIETKDLFITLVDASTSQPIKYEGHDDNPKMQRVLLTHEAICTRCSLQKSCGNKNEAPSDPLVVSKGIMKFFLKCNQNCLKGAGNPRDMRRFAIAISFEDITRDQTKICALSNKIFVHNNSKHNRKRKRETDIKPLIEPSEIAYVYPRVGVKESSFAFYSREWSREDVSFRCENVYLPVTSLIPKVGLTVQLPYMLHSGRLSITVLFDNAPAFTFPYDVQEKYQSDMMKAPPGFLCLYRPNRNNCEVNIGPNNCLVFVSDPLEFPDHCNFSNSVCPSIPLHYVPSQNYPYSSASPASEGAQLSGSDSSPTYLSGY